MDYKTAIVGQYIRDLFYSLFTIRYLILLFDTFTDNVSLTIFALNYQISFISK